MAELEPAPQEQPERRPELGEAAAEGAAVVPWLPSAVTILALSAVLALVVPQTPAPPQPIPPAAVAAPTAAPAEGACGPAQAHFYTRLQPNNLFQKSFLMRVDPPNAACPINTTPVPMPEYSARWAASFGAQTCYCKLPGEGKGP